MTPSSDFSFLSMATMALVSYRVALSVDMLHMAQYIYRSMNYSHISTRSGDSYAVILYIEVADTCCENTRVCHFDIIAALASHLFSSTEPHLQLVSSHLSQPLQPHI